VGSIVELEMELSGTRLEARNVARINIRDSASLVPQAIVNKALQSNGRSEVVATAYLISVQGKRSMGIGDVRRGPSGT
jgi:hypothetical protein